MAEYNQGVQPNEAGEFGDAGVGAEGERDPISRHQVRPGDQYTVMDCGSDQLTSVLALAIHQDPDKSVTPLCAISPSRVTVTPIARGSPLFNGLTISVIGAADADDHHPWRSASAAARRWRIQHSYPAKTKSCSSVSENSASGT